MPKSSSGGQVEQRCPPSRLGLLSYPVVDGSGDAPALPSGAPAGTAATFLITTSPSQPSEGCTGSFLGPKIAALYGNGYTFALLHAETLGMASTTPGVTAGGADARGGNAGLCWDLFSRKGFFLQRNISSSNTEFKMELGAFLCPCSIHQQSQLGTMLGCSPGVPHSQMSLEGEFLGWLSPHPSSSLPSCGAVQAEPGGGSLCWVKPSCI